MSREKKFTEGPWEYREESFNANGDLDQIGSIFGDDWYITAIEAIDSETYKANANLISAAPLMYLFLAIKADCGDNDAKLIMEVANGNEDMRNVWDRFQTEAQKKQIL